MTWTGTEYFRRVLSPWVPGVDNPLPEWVDRAARPEGLAVDVGCGPGVLTCYLAQRFGRVIAIDRDREMAEATGELVAKLRAQGAPFGDVEVRCQDWVAVDDIAGAADLVCAVNSILEPAPEKRFRLLRGLTEALVPERGRLLAIFPAMEAQVHLLRLFDDALRERGMTDGEVAEWMEQELFEAHSFDALAGTFASRGEPPQKFCYHLELALELKDAGLQVDEISPVIYPWEVCAQVDAGYFPGATEMFDWFVRARRATGAD